MERSSLAPRLSRLPVATVLGVEAREATSFRARLLGLALLDRREAGAGLLIPSCSSIHTFGMRFPLDVFLLDASGAVVALHRNIGPRRFLFDAAAAAVLEIPSVASAA